MPNPNLAEARKKALESPQIGKHGKAKKTLEKEKRRAIFDEMVSEEWKEIIGILPATYKADQFMGKTPDIIGVSDDLKEFLESYKKRLNG